jgi:DNA-binding CsgD family transcriptional regulator
MLQAETIDAFAGGCRELIAATMPFHSLCVSFSRLEYVCPWLIRDTLPIPADLSYFNERYHALNPSLPFLRRNIGIGQSLLTDQLDCMPSEARESYQQRFRRPEGWDKYAEIHFWDQRTLQAQICVRRDRSTPEFSGRDLRFLAELRETLAGAVDRLYRQHRDRAANDSLRRVLSGLPVPLLLLNWNLDAELFSAPARSLCVEWRCGPEAARTLKPGRLAEAPAEIAAACEAWKAELNRAGYRRPAAARETPRFRTVFHSTHRHLHALIELIEPAHDLIALPRFLVRFQSDPTPPTRPAPASAPASRALATLACLSPAEREIARLVADGLTNQEIAVQLSRAVPTVKMHLRSIFRKLAITNRSRIARLLAERT